MRLTIGQKLGFGFGGILLLIVISSIAVFLALERINASANQVTQKSLPMLRVCDDLLIAINRTTSTTRGLILLGVGSPIGVDLQRDAVVAMRDTETKLEELKTLYEVDTGFQNEAAYKRILSTSSEFLDSQRQVRSLAEKLGTGADRDLAEATTLLESFSVPKAREMRSATEELRDQASRRMKVSLDDLERYRASAKWILLGSTILALILGSVVATKLTNSLSTTLRSLLAGVRMVAAGNLLQPELEVQTSDEVGDLTIGFNQMVSSLRSILRETGLTTKEVSAASGQINTGAQQQLTSLNETAASLNEITTTAEEFKATMQEFADRAKAVHEAADETARRASEGLSLSRESTSRIEKVRENAISSASSVVHLAEQMQRIGEITASVNEIAEQTKLLALNASIEAARAGEEGRGFAVVAMQVRELANQSKDAAGRIEGLITQTQKSVQNVVTRIEEGGRLSDDSTSNVRNVSAAFEEIVKALDQTRQAMAQINTGARQQELGIAELVSSIVEIDAASKESVAAAEQTRQALQAIDGRLQTLDDLVSQFKVTGA